MNSMNSLEVWSKTKSETWPEDHLHEIHVPEWITTSEAFPGSVLSTMLTIPKGTGYGFFMAKADPLSLSTGTVRRAINDLVHGWMSEHLADPADLDPSDYLFEPSGAETVPSAWLEALFAMPVRERTSLVMDSDDE